MTIIIIAGFILQSKFELTMIQYLVIILEIFIIIIAYSSIFTLISLICSNVTISITINMIMFLMMYVVCSGLGYTINIPKEITETYYGENGTSYIISSELNPNYPSELTLKICKPIYYCFPQGQALELTEKRENVNHINLILYSVGFSIVSTVIGMYIFNKKELR